MQYDFTVVRAGALTVLTARPSVVWGADASVGFPAVPSIHASGFAGYTLAATTEISGQAVTSLPLEVAHPTVLTETRFVRSCNSGDKAQLLLPEQSTILTYISVQSATRCIGEGDKYRKQNKEVQHDKKIWEEVTGKDKKQ